jgi:hypothetical protein
VRRLHPKLWQQKNWLLHHDNAPSQTSFLTWEFFYQKQHDCSPPPTLLFFVSPIKDKNRHFDTIEVIEAELQAVLNILTEHNFQDPFKKWQKRWEQCIHVEGDNFEGDGSQ